MPEDKRHDMFLDNLGVIIVSHPAQYTNYLDSLETKFKQDGGELFNRLVALTRQERDIVEKLGHELEQTLQDQEFSTPRKVRTRVMGFNGRYEQSIPGRLDLTAYNPYNNLRGQTLLDFYRSLDRALLKGRNGEEVNPDNNFSVLDRGRVAYVMFGAGGAYWNLLRRSIPEFSIRETASV